MNNSLIFNINAFAKRINEERKNHDPALTQEALAEKIGVARQTISKWEKAIVYPDVNDLYNLCNAFNCDPGYLLGEYDDATTYDAQFIHDYTGLSDNSIAVLHILKNQLQRLKDEPEPWAEGIAIGNFQNALYNQLILDTACVTQLAIAGYEINRINSYGLNAEQKQTFFDKSTAIDFYKYQIVTALSSLVYGLIYDFFGIDLTTQTEGK